jgi:hypothetical protein
MWRLPTPLTLEEQKDLLREQEGYCETTAPYWAMVAEAISDLNRWQPTEEAA